MPRPPSGACSLIARARPKSMSLAPDRGVGGTVHFAHSSRAERGEDLIGAELETGRERHPGNLPHIESFRRAGSASRDGLALLGACEGGRSRPVCKTL